MSAAPRIADYDDASFDPFATFDRASGFGEVDDPFPQLHALHRAGAVQKGDLREVFGLQPFPFWKDYPSWMVFGYDAVSRVYGDAQTFSSAIMQRLYADSFGESINGMDAPDHARYRRLFQKAFMPQTVAKWGNELVPHVVNSIIDTFAQRGHAELVSEFTVLYPFHVIYGQLHLPSHEREVFHKLAVGLMCIGVDHAHALEASRNMGDYFSVLVQERRAKLVGANTIPEDDMVSMLALAEVDGERLPDEITVSFLRQLMNAAGDTTYRSTGALLVGLLTHPEQLDAVQRDRTLVPQAIEEALRWDGPLTVLTRQATRDIVLDGVAIPAGAKIDVVQGTANRDPARFADPDSFNIFRKPERNMAFAYGPHVCIGQHLARLEMARALNGLLDRLPKLRLDPDKPAPRILGFNSRAPLTIHVRFD
jgi:cytochrome P450